MSKLNGKQHDKTNLFGGKNARGLYVPMTEVEQEAVSRLIEADELVLIIHGWGQQDKPQIILGDHRIGVKFRMTFNRPTAPMEVYFFDLELKTRTGISLCKERLPCEVGGQPLQVMAGIFLDLQWDIAIHSMDPKLVKALVPGARGLTSRRQDRDTGLMTTEGNMKLNGRQRKALRDLDEGNAKMRAEDTVKAVKATRKSGYQVKKRGNALIAPDLK